MIAPAEAVDLIRSPVVYAKRSEARRIKSVWEAQADALVSATLDR